MTKRSWERTGTNGNESRESFRSRVPLSKGTRNGNAPFLGTNQPLWEKDEDRGMWIQSDVKTVEVSNDYL